MKKLDDFRLVRNFLSAQGIEPTIAMVAVRDPEWLDLVILAQQWRQEIEEAAEEEKAKLDAMTPEEKDQALAEAEEEARMEREKVMFHSCGRGRT
jgi:arsenate reductase-like glutaredoxin family protein